MFYLLRPREVANVDKSVNTFFEFNENTEVSEVANFSSVLRFNRLFHFDSLPWIFLELLDAKRHLTLVAVKCKDDSFNLVTNLQEVLC